MQEISKLTTLWKSFLCKNMAWLNFLIVEKLIDISRLYTLRFLFERILSYPELAEGQAL
jgi:hypothetical protein